MKATEMNKRDYLATLVYIHQLQSTLLGHHKEAYRDSRLLNLIYAGCSKIEYDTEIMYYTIECGGNEVDLLNGGEDDPDLSLTGNCLVTLGNIIG